MKYEVPCPRPAHRSFADPSGNIFEVKLCINATIRPNFFRFFRFFQYFLDLSFLLISSFSSLIFNFFLFFSSYPSLLISSYSSRRCYSSSSYSSFFDPFGVKIRVYTPVRPDVLTIFVLFFCINIMSPAPTNRSCADPYGVIND
jgi:hypothetical protein